MLNLHSKSVNSQTFYNFLGTVLRAGVGFFTMPIFTRMLGAEQYGLYAIYVAWLGILTCVMGMSVNACVGTGYYKYSENFPKFRNSVLVEGTIFGLALGIVCLSAFGILQPLFKYSFAIFTILLIDALCAYIFNFAGNTWIIEKKAAQNMLLSLVMLMGTTILSVSFIYYFSQIFEPLYYARVFGTFLPKFLLAGFVWFLLFKEFPVGYNKEYWDYGLLFGIPTIFHALSHNILGQANRVMMGHMDVSGVDIGVYSFFFTFVSILTQILNALNTSWVPFLYDDLKDRAYEKLDEKVVHYVQIFTVMCCGFLLLAHEVVKIFANSEYWYGAPIVPLMVVVVYLTFMYQFPVNYEFFHAKPRIIAIGTGGAAVINILLNYFLIPSYGMYGAAIATVLSYGFLAVFHIIIVNNWSLERYPLKMLPVYLGFGAVLAFCLLYYVLEGYILIRWLFALVIGVHLIHKVYMRRTIF